LAGGSITISNEPGVRVSGIDAGEIDVSSLARLYYVTDTNYHTRQTCAGGARRPG